MLLHNIFENQAKQTPYALAIKSNGLEFSYQNIDESANRVANYLISTGVESGNLVESILCVQSYQL